MAPRLALAPALALLLVASALAGCASPPPPAPAPPEEDAPMQPGLVSTQEASNVSAQEAEQSEFAKSLDEKFHTHNYWGGALEKVIMDENVDSAPIVQDSGFGPLGTVFFSTFGLLFGTTTEFGLPEGDIVPPEAERLEVVITWAESPTITGLQFGYVTAAPDDAFGWYGTVPSDGTPMVIGTNLTSNDIPHMTVSKWRFFLQPDSGETGFGGMFNGTVHVTITAFRNDTLFVAPPHPDFWGTATTMNLTQNSSRIKGTAVLFPFSIGFLSDDDADNFAFIEMPEGKIVPPHTGVVHATLSWTNNGTLPNPQNLHPRLGYFTAGSRGFDNVEPATADDTHAEYLLPVDPRDWDSPYANQSDWGFFVFLASDSPTQQAFGFGDLGDFDGSFQLDVAAEREVV
jgi:hypothetical protein